MIPVLNGGIDVLGKVKRQKYIMQEIQYLKKRFHPYPKRKKSKVLFRHYSHLLYKDAQVLRNIHNKKSDYIYILAAKLPRMVERWIKDTGIKTLRYHLKELTKKVPHSINTLRQAYYIGKCFPDLIHDPFKRILPQSCYREIAGADIENSEVEKSKLRWEAEEENYTVSQIRDILHERYKIGRKDRIEKRFEYYPPVSQFVKEIGQYILKHKEIIEGSEIRIIAKFPKKEKKP